MLKVVKKKKINIGKNVKVKFVKDRPGHDLKYALNSKKIRKSLSWRPKKNFINGLSDTFDWYFKNYDFFKIFSKNKFYKRLGLKI